MWKRLVVLAAALLILTAACTSAGREGRDRAASPSSTSDYRRGGTLRVADVFTRPVGIFDPQKTYGWDQFEIFRCCLLRTLLSYNGRPLEEGGAELHPDLAGAMPEVSDDGLSWTFHLDVGIHYGPPFADTEVVAADVVRALEREADPAVTKRSRRKGYPFMYSVIRGFDEYVQGAADSIAGLETPDAHTLVVRLEQPTGDLGYRLSLPASSPIPPGAADGHDTDYGPYLVATGPYMWEGSEALDPSRRPDGQEPAPGYLDPHPFDASVGRAWVLVRNPSWDPETDDLRPAYVDRIEIVQSEMWGNNASYYRIARTWAAQVDAGVIDMNLGATSTWGRQLRRYRADPALRPRVVTGPGGDSIFIPMNPAVAPFDDLHVRRAVALAIDREEVVRLLGGSKEARQLDPTAHLAPDSVEGGLLDGFHPSWLRTGGADAAAAVGEMRRSTYDTDGDGRCDGPECRVLVLAWRPDIRDTGWDAPVLAGMRRLGLRPVLDTHAFLGRFADPGERWGLTLCSYCGWKVDYPNGANFFLNTMHGSAIGSSADENYNYSMLGATPQQLAAWGYEVRTVPNVDARIEACVPLVGLEQTRCWASLDQHLMGQVVPWIPLAFEAGAWVVSERVVHHSWDQFANAPALDHFSLAPGSE